MGLDVWCFYLVFVRERDVGFGWCFVLVCFVLFGFGFGWVLFCLVLGFGFGWVAVVDYLVVVGGCVVWLWVGLGFALVVGFGLVVFIVVVFDVLLSLLLRCGCR